MILTDVLPEKIDQVSKILADILSEAKFDDEKFQIERKIIMHEIAEVEDDPWTTADELLRKSLFKTHPIRRPVLGLRKTVSKITLPMIEEAYRSNFTTDNIILVLTGNFSEKNIETVSQQFCNMPYQQKRSDRKNYCEKKCYCKDITKEKTGITQAYLSIGAKTVSTKHPDTPAIDVIDTILGAGASSRLFIEMREKRALAYSIESGHEYGSDYGYFHINCSISPKRVEQTKKIVCKEIAKLLNEKIPVQEIDKAKDMITGSILRTIDSPADFPETIANMEIQYENQNALQEYIIKIKNLTDEDIMQAANRHN